MAGLGFTEDEVAGLLSAGFLARYQLLARRNAGERATIPAMTPAHLLIVPRADPQLFDYLSRRLSGVSRVEVILDRRAGERRRSDRPAADRRRGERRSPAFRVNTTLGCAMIAVEREGHDDLASGPDIDSARRTLLWPSQRLRDLPPPHIAST